jgi:hypothetical protein
VKRALLLLLTSGVDCACDPVPPGPRVTSYTITQPGQAPIVVTGEDLDTWSVGRGCIKVTDYRAGGFLELARACGDVAVTVTPGGVR